MAFNTDNLFKVDGMVAVVTGGGTGLGLHIAQALASAGASKVFILGRRLNVLETAAATHPALIPVQCDVTSKDSLEAAASTVSAQASHVNLLVANSGVVGNTRRIEPSWDLATIHDQLWEQSMEDFTSTLHVNVTGVQYTILAFLTLLGAGNDAAVRGGFGAPLSSEGSAATVPSIQSQVVIIGSVGAYLRTTLSSFSYATSKLAVTHVGKLWASRLAKFGIRCNIVQPGFFPTEMAGPLIAHRDPGSETPDDAEFIPARRFGGKEEMGGSFIYLASRAGAFMNGTEFLMDGGRLCVTQSTY